MLCNIKMIVNPLFL